MSTGVDNSETIKVSRSGGADPDGYGPGDLYVIIKVCLVILVSGISRWTSCAAMILQKVLIQVKEDPVFRREGSDIHVDAVLSITQVFSMFLFLYW